MKYEGYWSGYSYVVITDEDIDGRRRTMEFSSEEEANEYFK